MRKDRIKSQRACAKKGQRSSPEKLLNFAQRLKSPSHPTIREMPQKTPEGRNLLREEQLAKVRRCQDIVKDWEDPNDFSLWRDGELAGSIVRLAGDIETSGADLKGDVDLVTLFSDFLHWQPAQPRSVKDLATMSARLCRLSSIPISSSANRASSRAVSRSRTRCS